MSLWDDYRDECQTPREVECKRCGKGGLHWAQNGGDWLLIEGVAKIHRCAHYQPKADDFDVMES